MKKILYLFVAITTFACNTTTKKDEKKMMWLFKIPHCHLI